MWKEGEGMAPLRVMGTGVLQRPSVLSLKFCK